MLAASFRNVGCALDVGPKQFNPGHASHSISAKLLHFTAYAILVDAEDLAQAEPIKDLHRVHLSTGLDWRSQMTKRQCFARNDTESILVALAKWRRSVTVFLVAIAITAGIVTVLHLLTSRDADSQFRVLYQSQILVDGEVLAFTTLDSPEFDPNPSVGFFAFGNPWHPLKPWTTNRLSVFIASPYDADFTLVASARDKGTREEAVEIKRVDVKGRSIAYGGGVPAGGIVFVPPDLLAVNCEVDLTAPKGINSPRFYQIRDGSVVPIGQFTHPASGCNVRKLSSIGTGKVVIYVEIESNSENRFEIITYDVQKGVILAQVASTIDGKNGSQLAVDAAQTNVAVANHELVELRRLPDLMLVSDFARPDVANECIAVSNQGRFVAIGGLGTWLWSANDGRCRKIHAGRQEPKLSLKYRGAYGDHLDHGAFVHNYLMHSRRRVKFVGFLGNTMQLVEVTGDGVVAKWDLEQPQLLESGRLWD